MTAIAEAPYNPRACGARCDVCPLKGRTPVPPEARHHAQIAVVGDYPGDADVKYGRPMVGPAGTEFDKALRSAGSDRGKVFITNVLLCRPPDGDLDELKRGLAREAKENSSPLPPTPEECCRPRLMAELQRFDDVIPMANLRRTHSCRNVRVASWRCEAR